VKKEANQRIVIAATPTGLSKIYATGDWLTELSFLPYPGFEGLDRSSARRTLLAALVEGDAAVDDLVKKMSAPQLRNGAHALIDKDGFHSAVFSGQKMLKTSDDNRPDESLRMVKVTDVGKQIVALGMTYDGFLAAAAAETLFLIDRDLNIKASLPLPGTAVEN